jgi:hypothetical protein
MRWCDNASWSPKQRFVVWPSEQAFARIEFSNALGDDPVDCGGGCEGWMGEVKGLEIAPDELDAVELGGVYLGSRSTMSEDPRVARATNGRLLVWISPFSSTSTTGLTGRPGRGPQLAVGDWPPARDAVFRFAVFVVHCHYWPGTMIEIA